MNKGKVFEIFINKLLESVGFSRVASDGMYIFDGAAGQMIQGLGEAHNADVLVEPPVQTPFYALTRLLVECKNYEKKVGLNTLRSAFGLREDINQFNIVDTRELSGRQGNRGSIIHQETRYQYQVALAATNGFTKQAQNFALAHRIPLIDMNKMPFWTEIYDLIESEIRCLENDHQDDIQVLQRYAEEAAEKYSANMAVAITNLGQLLFLYRIQGKRNVFSGKYTLHWGDIHSPWELKTVGASYSFQLPETIAKKWITQSSDDLSRKINALHCKERFLSSMIVYYRLNHRPQIKMISIDELQLLNARHAIKEQNEN